MCPNCRAEYDISADAIPPEGRELQCSSCEYTWFVAPLQVVGRPRDAAFVSRRRELDLPDLPQNADGPGEDEPFEDEEADEDAPDFPLKRRNPNLSAQLQALASELGPSAFAPEDEEPELPLDPPMAAPKRQVDPEVLAVLRQEAEVETKARRQEARVALESQLELGEFPQPRRSTAASELHERLERLKAAER
ncbi:MAG: zinc-ribbon domain-containing protein, partial [Mangrovicoccus sp.]